MGFDWGWDKPLYIVKGRFDRWRPPFQLMNLRFWSVVVALAGVGGVYHVFVSRFCVPQVPGPRQLLLESVVFPTDPHPGAHGGI